MSTTNENENIAKSEAVLAEMERLYEKHDGDWVKMKADGAEELRIGVLGHTYLKDNDLITIRPVNHDYPEFAIPIGQLKAMIAEQIEQSKSQH